MRPFKLLLIFLLVTFPVTEALSFSASDADFQFMELRRQLREHPEDPKAGQYLFAIGEYYFNQQNLFHAAEYFRKLQPKPSQSDGDFLATIYLLRCALMAKDFQTASGLEKELRDTLSSHPYFSAFRKSRARSWTSPFGNRFDFEEAVDQLEIKLNGKSFYILRLS